MNWFERLMYKTAGGTRSTQGESERSWRSVVTIMWLVVAACLMYWAIRYPVTDRDLLWLILFSIWLTRR